jgi:hypothetical protein
MKRITILILALSTLSVSAAFGQEKQQQQKVAVNVSGEDAAINEMLSGGLSFAFIRNGKYSVIDRSASFLAESSKEQKYQQTGNVDANDILRLGEQFGVQLLCMVMVKDVAEGKKYVYARLIDVETGAIINTASATLSSIDESMNVAKDIVAKLTGETAK